MIDWILAGKLAVGGFGATLVVLAILCIVIWIIGFVLQRKTAKNKK
jgi:Na+-transporting methylmalonyl-CoA/oxaloacetate decarboxylase gamma subunit